MSKIGDMYSQSLGVDEDYAQALNWYQRAAEAGSDVALRHIGSLYGFGGFGVKQDYGRMLAWWRKAAEQGSVRAQWPPTLAAKLRIAIHESVVSSGPTNQASIEELAFPGRTAVLATKNM